MKAGLLTIALLALVAVPVLAAKPLPDLIVTSVSGVPGDAVGGTSITVRDTIVNHGGATAKASTTAYYLSFDGVKSADDIRLDGQRKTAALKPRRSSRGKTVVVLPTNLSGLFQVIACADAGSRVREARENNNCKPAARAIDIQLPRPGS
jgi:subtilase family serine protease